jgi:hypothetical protein
MFGWQTYLFHLPKQSVLRLPQKHGKNRRFAAKRHPTLYCERSFVFVIADVRSQSRCPLRQLQAKRQTHILTFSGFYYESAIFRNEFYLFGEIPAG